MKLCVSFIDSEIGQFTSRNKHSRGRGLFLHCAYATRGTVKGDSTREFPLDLYREHFQFAIFVLAKYNIIILVTY